VSCANGEQCPAGYTCAAFTVYNEVYTYYCYALCGYIQDAQSAKTQNTKPMSSRAR
jgi:hypothetical protein